MPRFSCKGRNARGSSVPCGPTATSEKDVPPALTLVATPCGRMRRYRPLAGWENKDYFQRCRARSGRWLDPSFLIYLHELFSMHSGRGAKSEVAVHSTQSRTSLRSFEKNAWRTAQWRFLAKTCVGILGVMEGTALPCAKNSSNSSGNRPRSGGHQTGTRPPQPGGVRTDESPAAQTRAAKLRRAVAPS